jgi:hypothetical protein
MALEIEGFHLTHPLILPHWRGKVVQFISQSEMLK